MRIFLSVTGGVVVGAVAAFQYATWTATTQATGATRPAPSTPNPELSGRISRLERLEWERSVRAATPAAPVALASNGPTSTPSPDNGKLDDRVHPEREFAARIEAHRKEPADPAWAPRAERSFAADVNRIIENGKLDGRVLNVRCATVTCTIRMEWSSWEAARKNYAALLHSGAYEQQCAQMAVLPEPSDPAAPYVGTLLFSCEDARAQH